MKRITRLVVFITMFIGVGAHAASLEGLDKDIEKTIQKFGGNVNIGIAVRDLARNKTIYQKNEDRYFVPASSLKILTAAGSLIYLGPDYRFETALLTDGHVLNNGILDGNLYLKFSGSPSFTLDKLYKLLAKLKRLGIRGIDKNIYLLPSNTSAKPYGPGWMLEDLDYAFSAPPLPFILDKNQFEITINPGPIGQKTKISFQRSSLASFIKVVNETKTKASNQYCRISYTMDESNTLFVRGCLKVNDNAQEKNIAIRNPALYLTEQVKTVLRNLSIQVEGKVLSSKGGARGELVELASVRSSKLSYLIAPMLKESDNLYADSLFLTLGKAFYKTSVSYRKAGLALKKVLGEYANFSLSKSVIVDGSGMSRYDLITPSQLTSTLAFLYQQFPLSFEFLASLPVSGRDGTLYKRHLNSYSTHFIRAKTGTMQGVVSLAGFLPSQNGRPLAFAIVINGIPEGYVGIDKFKKLEDELAKILLTIKVKPPVLQKARQLGKGKELPFERRLNADRNDDEKRRLAKIFERDLRSRLSGLPVQILREGQYLEVYPLGKTLKATTLQARVFDVMKKHRAYGIYRGQGLINGAYRSHLIFDKDSNGRDGTMFLLWQG